MVYLQGKLSLVLTFLYNSQMILLIQSKIQVKIRKFPSLAHRTWEHSLYTTAIVGGLPVENLERNLWHKSGKKEICINAKMLHLLFKNVGVSAIYTHIHKVSNYFAVCGPPVDQQYVYHSFIRWTTDGSLVANLTIFFCNKIQNNYFWKVIHLKQMNLTKTASFQDLSKQMPFSRA